MRNCCYKRGKRDNDNRNMPIPLPHPSPKPLEERHKKEPRLMKKRHRKNNKMYLRVAEAQKKGGGGKRSGPLVSVSMTICGNNKKGQKGQEKRSGNHGESGEC